MSRAIRYITAKLDEVAHSALLRRASEIGCHITELAARYIEAGLVADNNSSSLEMRLFRAANDAKQRDIVRAQLEHIAYTAMRDENEPALETLKGLCKDAGVQVDDVIDAAMKFGGATAESGSDTMTEAKVFIMSLLRGGPVEAREAIEAGKERGFSAWMMSQAKVSLGVESVRDGMRRLWRIGGEDGKGEMVQ